MLDAFYVHVRLLADFLVRTTKRELDFGPADFDVQWTAPQTAEAVQLGKHWETASKYVVHFGRDQVPEDREGLDAFQIGAQAFKTIATDSLFVFAKFIRLLETRTPTWSEGQRAPDHEAEPEGRQIRMLADRITSLRLSFIEACGKVGLDGENLLDR